MSQKGAEGFKVGYRRVDDVSGREEIYKFSHAGGLGLFLDKTASGAPSFVIMSSTVKQTG